jgi:hypothetical protein
MNKAWIISKLLESYDDSKKEEHKEWFGESLYNKLTHLESSNFDDLEEGEISNYFYDMITDYENFDQRLEDPWIGETEEGGVYYQFRVGASIEKLGIYFIYYYDDNYFLEFDSFDEMEKEFYDV